MVRTMRTRGAEAAQIPALTSFLQFFCNRMSKAYGEKPYAFFFFAAQIQKSEVLYL